MEIWWQELTRYNIKWAALPRVLNRRYLCAQLPAMDSKPHYQWMLRACAWVMAGNINTLTQQATHTLIDWFALNIFGVHKIITCHHAEKLKHLIKFPHCSTVPNQHINNTAFQLPYLKKPVGISTNTVCSLRPWRWKSIQVAGKNWGVV